MRYTTHLSAQVGSEHDRKNPLLNRAYIFFLMIVLNMQWIFPAVLFQFANISVTTTTKALRILSNLGEAKAKSSSCEAK